MTIFRVIYRLIVFIIIVLAFIINGVAILIFVKDPKRRLIKFSNSTQLYCGMVVRGLGIKVIPKNKPHDLKNVLFVANHMGFLDIMAIASLSPMLFVTSIEMKNTPGLGILTQMGGCLYTDRRSRGKIMDELKTLIEALKGGLSIVLYPESKATNGEAVLPFKRTLMMSAGYAGVPIQPLVVNFTEINGESGFRLKWRDHVCWYGEMSFLTAFSNALTLKSVTLEIEFLEQIHPSPQDDRAEIADRAHALIARNFVPARDI